MNKLYQYTILSKDIINLVGKYLLPSKNSKLMIHNELLIKTKYVKLYCNGNHRTYFKRKYKYKDVWYIAVVD